MASRIQQRSPVDLSDVAAFAEVVETGGFARAGERLGISKSIVSRRVARLERDLGTRLLARSARGAEPTEIGRDYHRRLAGIFADLEAAREAVAGATTEIAGPIRMTAPVSFGVNHLAPSLARFLEAHPRVELDLVLEDRRADLIGEHFDLAVRIGALPDSALVARRLGPVEAAIVASPAYLAARGRPLRPRDLAGHEMLAYSLRPPSSGLRFTSGEEVETVRTGGSRLRANNGDAIREAAKAGLGVAILPTFILGDAIETSALVALLEDWSLDVGAIYAVTPPGRAPIARVRALVDHLARGCAAAERARSTARR